MLVMFGHFVGTGMYASTIDGVIQTPMEKGILEWTNTLVGLDQFIYFKLHTQAACVGVVMFFLCTGFLIPGMLKRYTRKGFLVNRLCRIYPCLIVSVIIVVIIPLFTQGIRFGADQIITSMTLTFELTGSVACMGILWTLVVEMLFYLFAAAVKDFSEHTPVLILLAAVLAGLIYEMYDKKLLYNLFYNLRYMGFCAVGAMISVTFDDKELSFSRKAVRILGCFLANYLVFRANQTLIGDDTVYPNLTTQLLPFALLLLLLTLEKKSPRLFEKIPGRNILYHLASLVYPVYLTHVCVGFTVMYYVSRATGSNNAVTLLSGVAASFIIAEVVAVFIEKPSIKLSRRAVSKLEHHNTHEEQ